MQYLEELPKISANTVKREAWAILKLVVGQIQHTVAQLQMNSCTYKFYESKAVHIPLKYLTKIQKKITWSQTTAVFKNDL